MIKVANVNKIGNKIIGYTCKAELSKEELVSLIKQGMVENAYIQVYKGTTIVRVKDAKVKMHSKEDNKHKIKVNTKQENGIEVTNVSFEKTDAKQTKPSVNIETINKDNAEITNVMFEKNNIKDNSKSKVKVSKSANDIKETSEIKASELGESEDESLDTIFDTLDDTENDVDNFIEDYKNNTGNGEVMSIEELFRHMR